MRLVAGEQIFDPLVLIIILLLIAPIVAASASAARLMVPFGNGRGFRPRRAYLQSFEFL